MEYRDSLPSGCPPDEAEEIRVATDIFRVVWNSPVKAEDFHSCQTLRPMTNFGTNSCIARGLSVLRSKTACADMLKLPKFQKGYICRIRLNPGDGRIQQTGRARHHTWWPHRMFDHNTSCSVVAA